MLNAALKVLLWSPGLGLQTEVMGNMCVCVCVCVCACVRTRVRVCVPVALTMWHPLSAKVGTNFANKRRSLCQYSLIADSGHRVYIYIYVCMCVCMWEREKFGISIMMSIIHKLMHKLYFSKYAYLETLILGQALYWRERNYTMIGAWRKLHSDELHSLNSSSSISRRIKSRRVRWAGYVAWLGGKSNAYRKLVGKPEGKRNYKDQNIVGWIILRWILER
jgi:hypothetical protein